MSKKLTHVDDKGKAVMVDVGDKPLQNRTARASGKIILSAETVKLIHSNSIRKGDVLTVAQIAGIQAAKKTAELIPLCHPLPITKIEVNAEFVEDGIKVTSMVRCIGQTGVEMEALTAVQVALLTIYDMCKAVDKQMKMQDIQLVEKVKE